MDRVRAIASRRQSLGQAARAGCRVARAHLPFPGLGHVRAEGAAYAWVPAEFSPLPAVAALRRPALQRSGPLCRLAATTGAGPW